MFGSFFGRKEIVELMVNHSIAKQLYSKKERTIIAKYGYLIFKLFGYPLAVVARQRAKIVIRLLKPKSGERILDAGCGIGDYSFELAAKYGCLVVGIDIDNEDIKLATKMAKKARLSKVTFIEGDITNLPFPDNMFDKIIILDVIQSIPDDKKVLNELFRIIKKGGNLIITTSHVDKMEEYSSQQLKDYSGKQLQISGGRVRNGYSFHYLSKLLNDVGFNVVEHRYYVKKFTKEVGGILFFTMYPISMLDYFIKGTGKGIAIKAKKI